MEEGSSTSINSTSFDAYNGGLQTSALTATRKAAALPGDIAFHRSMDQSLAQDLDSLAERVLSITNRLLSLVSTADQSQAKGKGKTRLESEDDVVDNFHSVVVDTIDQLLEKTDTCLDEFLGKNKAPAIPINPPVPSNKPGVKAAQKPGGRNEPVIQHAAYLTKPQLSFKKPPDNSDAPWHPTLSHKYNAKVPLGYVYHDSDAESGTVVSNHPYRYEITHLSYPPRMSKPCTPVQPPSLDDTTATWVDTPVAFQSMLSKLKNAAEIAVDLEHHSYRSYAGFLCLMQISDREEDWVVDLLAVREEVEALNEVFTDPAIVKVFHGADSDIVWLQQDFNLYIVNLFDTFHASKLLEFPRHGLANLLEMYCDFVPDKRYQLADWRIRPLPADMLLYARSDTHFLLFIYDNLRNALLDRSKSSSRSPTSSPPPGASASSASSSSKGNNPTALLDQALSRSAETSLRVYSKEPYDAEDGAGPGGWDTLAKRWNKGALLAGGPGVGVGAMQREVYKAVHAWRERVAREEDESTRYVLQNHFLFMLTEEPPADLPALLKVFRTSVPPVVKLRAKDLLNVVREAVKRGLPLVHPVAKGPVDVVFVETRKDVVMLESEIKSLESTDGNLRETKNIWGAPTNQGSVSTPHSSLFGSSPGASSAGGSSRAHSSGIAFSTSVSALFGTGKPACAILSGVAPSTSKSVLDTMRFKELVMKINKSLALAPSVPQIPAITANTPGAPSAEPKQEVDETTGMEVEIPYVPASQRTTRQVPVKEESDTIVVVGQARKKRKRKAVEAAGSADEGAKAKEEEATKSAKGDDKEPFDFATVPNILDDNPDLDEGAKKRKRQKKQGNKAGTFYGDFPAPPKAHSELKSGNQSYTFK